MGIIRSRNEQKCCMTPIGRQTQAERSPKWVNYCYVTSDSQKIGVRKLRSASATKFQVCETEFHSSILL